MNFWPCHTTTYVKAPNQTSPRDLPIDLARTARRTAVRYWILAMLFTVAAFSWGIRDRAIAERLAKTTAATHNRPPF